MKKWEYLEILSSTDNRFVGQNLSSKVIDAGVDGWELVQIIPKQYYDPRKHGSFPERWIFKREIIE